MNEGPPNESENNNDEREQKRKEIVDLARELGESHEGFPFPGIRPESYAKLKADEEEYPGCSTPIDELIERFANEGMKVVLGAHPESGNVYLLPLGSDDIENDSLLPRSLQIDETMDEKLKQLISLKS
jgi:sugar phosphate isomerase/epimerase